MPTAVEEQYPEVLQSIQSMIAGVCRETPGLLDYDVHAALDCVLARYEAERLGRDPRPVVLRPGGRAVYGAVLSACERRLGRQPPDGASDAPEDVIGLDEMVACIKRVRRLARRWTQHRGRQGYLSFVAGHLS